jgi:hypothetical protein
LIESDLSKCLSGGFPVCWREISTRSRRTGIPGWPDRGVAQGWGPNGIPNRVVSHLPKCTIPLLTEVFNIALRRQYLPPPLRHPCMVSILKPEENPPPPNLFHTLSMIFEATPLTEYKEK